MAKQVIGKNVEAEVSKDGKLTLTIDLNKTNGLSKSGKTQQVATTNGFAWNVVGDKIGVSVNVNRL